jgi:hypothetical protein
VRYKESSRKYNVDVILLDRWRVFCYVDGNKNLIHEWFAQNEVSYADRIALQARLDIYEYCGLPGILASTVDLGNGFRAMLCQRKGGTNPCPVFCEGPFGEDEITFLAGASWNVKTKRPEPRYVAGIAEERLEVLQLDRKRRRLEGFT